MKTLMLLRHAKSSWDGGVTRDFDRPLNARGRAAARAIGQEMKRLDLGFDRVLASPAQRVVETLREVETGYGSKLDVDIERRIYLASPDILLELVQEAGDSHDRLLLAGHNPGLERLALLLSGSSELRDELANKYPTGTLAEIDVPVARWTDITAGAGTLTRFVRPRDLDAALGPDEDS